MCIVIYTGYARYLRTRAKLAITGRGRNVKRYAANFGILVGFANVSSVLTWQFPVCDGE